MQESFEIKAQMRTGTGRCESRRLRKLGQVPAIIYGAQKEPVMASLNHNELSKHLEHEAFYSHILRLDLEGTIENVVLKDMQRHPARPLVLHVDLLRVSAEKSIRMLVPLRFINEDKCPGVKKGGTITRSLTEIEISCLPKDLPEFIAVNMEGLEMSHTLHVRDLTLPAGVGISHSLDPKAPVVSIHGTRGADAEPPAAAVAATPPAAAKA